MSDVFRQSTRFNELRAFYTQKDINEAKKENKLFFFDVGYFAGFNMEHDGYSVYYENMDDLLDAAYTFMKKYKDDISAGDRRIHLRSIVEVIPGSGLAGNGYILGHMNLINNVGEPVRIRVSLDKKMDFCIDDFVSRHDDVCTFDEMEEYKRLIKKR